MVDELDSFGTEGKRIQRIGEFTDRTLSTGRMRKGPFDQSLECAGRLGVIEEQGGGSAEGKYQPEAE
jgi:hypothetical protein